MRIICAPDSFKESISAKDAAAAMARGLRLTHPDAEIDECPIADGGEGTVDAIVAATAGELRRITVTGPLGELVEAAWGMLGDGKTAVIEMAAAAGLALVPAKQRDPTRTTTFGVGELIRAAFDAGANRIILGIGGSATTDGGCGAAQALGVRFYADGDRLIETPITGGMLGDITRIDGAHVDARVRSDALTLACDVDNPLTGPQGAAHVYGPQKGATPEQIALLDHGLERLANLWCRDLGQDVSGIPGAGAAGGFGGGSVAMLKGVLHRGIDLVLDAVQFDRRVRGCDLCLTGEGRLDGQTLQGKAIAGVAAAARRHHVPVVALVGSVGGDVHRVKEIGIERYHVIGEGLTPEESMRRAAALLEAAAARLG